MINLYAALQLCQRIVGPFLYPLAYLLRNYIRTDEVYMRHEQARVKK